MKCRRCPQEAAPGYVHCAACVAHRRAYKRAWRGPRRITNERKAIAWLRGGEKTTRQVYALMGAVSVRCAWQALKQLEDKGIVRKVGRKWELIMDLSDFEEIPKRQRRDAGMTVTLGETFLTLNKAASEQFGDTLFVKLLVKKATGEIAILPAETGHKVTRRKGMISASIAALRTSAGIAERGRFRVTPLDAGGFLVKVREG